MDKSWPPIEAGEDIPAFLRLTKEERAEGWKNRPPPKSTPNFGRVLGTKSPGPSHSPQN